MEAFLDHLPMIMIVSGYTLDRNISMANHDHSEWVPTSSCENLMRYSPKYSIPDLTILIFILDVMLVLEFYTHTVLIGYSYGVPGWD